MFRFASRKAEDARTARFLHAITLSGRYSLNPTWELQEIPDETPDETPRPRRRIRKLATIVGTCGALIACTAGPAAAAGSVANSCAAIADVTIWKEDYSPSGRVPGWTIERLPCGQGTSDVYRATVEDRPFYVKTPGRAPFCMNAGQWIYPANRGAGDEMVLTPTIDCHYR